MQKYALPSASPMDKQLESLLKEAEKQAKKGKTKEAIATLKTSLEHKRLPSTLLRLSELHLDLFRKVAASETLQQAAEYSLRVLRSLPSVADAAAAEELLKRAGGSARARAEASLDAETKQGLGVRAPRRGRSSTSSCRSRPRRPPPLQHRRPSRPSRRARRPRWPTTSLDRAWRRRRAGWMR